MTAPLLGEARRFPTKNRGCRTRIYSERVYAQDADNIKYVYASPMKAAADLIKYNLVSFWREERKNDPETVKDVARQVLRASDGKAQNKHNKHRYAGFEWYMCNQ